MTPGARSARVADHVCARLYELGISTVFGVHGANIEDIFDAASAHPGITPVIAKHEFAAGAMADGVARMRGAPSAVLTTSGGGALNVIAALGESYDSRVPVLAVIGAPPSNTVGRGGFQDMLSPPDTIDLEVVLSGVVGAVAVVRTVDDVDAALDAGAATLRRSLPAAVVIPKNIAAQHFSEEAGNRRAHIDAPADVTAHPDPDVLDHIAETLCRTAGPGQVCIWSGEEAARHRLGGAVTELADLLGATTVVSPGGRDVAGPGCAGVTGVMGHPSAHAALAEASTILVLGCRMSLTDRAGLDDILAERTVVHLGAHPPRTGGVRHIGCDHLEYALAQVVSRVRRQSRCVPGAAAREVVALVTPKFDGPHPDMRSVIEAVGAALPDDAAVFADAGNTGAAAIHHLPFGVGRFAVALGMGGMGYAIAAGVGVAIAGGDGDTPRRTVVIAGDGSFLMHGMEIHTAIEHDAPITIVVANNDAHGMCRTREDLYFPATSSLNSFRHTDFAAGLDAMFPTLTVWHVTESGELDAALGAALTHPGPNCVVVEVDADDLPPFAPFLRGHP
jgi:acetolactate synthase-1/2/3 large subunit